MNIRLVNLLIDESRSMHGAPIESARQTAFQVLQTIRAADERHAEHAECCVWTFSDEAIALVKLAHAETVLELPLRSSGASMLGHALQSVLESTDSYLETLRIRDLGKRVTKPIIVTIVISDMEPSDDWICAAQRVAAIGRLSFLNTGTQSHKPPMYHSAMKTETYHCDSVTHEELSTLLGYE